MRIKRIISVDAARALCVIWIVAIWHMLDYYPYDELKRTLPVITTGVLGCFTFLSGLFCGKRQVSPLIFYKQRIRRFLLPLLISCISLCPLGYFNGGGEILLTVLGLGCFFPPQAPTVWYFSMLILFYWLTPFIIAENSKLKICIKGGVLFLLFCIYSQYFNLDKNVLKYFPLYIMGILTPTSIFEKIKQINKFSLGAVFIICVILYSTLVWANSVNVVFSLTSGILMTFTLILLGNLVTNDSMIKVLNAISFASMFAYLFHRQIYAIFKILFSDNNMELPICCFPLMLVSVFLFSYLAQNFYNKYIN